MIYKKTLYKIPILKGQFAPRALLNKSKTRTGEFISTRIYTLKTKTNNSTRLFIYARISQY